MKHAKLFLLLSALFLTAALAGFGQDQPPADEAQPRPMDRQQPRRPNLLAALGLSPEQVQQIRRMNQGRRGEMMRAQHRVSEATEALDMAIYADTYSEADYQARLKDFQDAQAEVARLRFEGELALRKVLTPEQLVKFRGLRDEFAQRRKNNIQNRREGRGGRDGRGFAPRRDVPRNPPPNAPPNKPIN